jgi:hypothetical protein
MFYLFLNKPQNLHHFLKTITDDREKRFRTSPATVQPTENFKDSLEQVSPV